MRLHARRRGAVLVEFMVTLVPVLTTFFTFVQLSKVATARLMVKHAAIVGARAAAVMANGKGNLPDQPKGTNEAEIKNGVKNALGPWWSKKGGITSVDITIKDASTKADPYDWVEVKGVASYACTVPMGWLACAGPAKRIEETFKMPHQGAVYEM